MYMQIWIIECKMIFTEYKYELLNTKMMPLNVATIRQPYYCTT